VQVRRKERKRENLRNRLNVSSYLSVPPYTGTINSYLTIAHDQ